MAQWLRVLNPPSKDLVQVPESINWLTAVPNFSSRVSDSLFRPLWVLGAQTYILAKHACKLEINTS